MWSGGLDKTPSCFGGGFAFFNNTPHGNSLYAKVKKQTDGFEVDSIKERFVQLCKMFIHFCLAFNKLYAIHLAGIVSIFMDVSSSEHETKPLRWYDIAYKIRKAKSVTPFQHQSSAFLTKPSLPLLYSVRYGLTKNYTQYISEELRKRNLFLKNIPHKYHRVLFPFFDKRHLDAYNANQGIGEFTWVYSGYEGANDRMKLNDYLCDRGFITLINTTWVFNTKSKLEKNAGQHVNDNLTYLPNLNTMNDRQIVKLSLVLADYCLDNHKSDV